ncbi:MAG: ASCH domain-containing protein [Proteobacteria bacterium]|nr:ASCH domain-containing protein [Pseudomonadota bacterium]
MPAAPMSDRVRAYWDAFLAGRTDDASARWYDTCVFDDNEPSANALADLVVRGIKRATAGLVWSYEAAGLPIPTAGDLSVVTTWHGEPVCIIETTRVDIVPFCDVTAEFAATEGEGDKSLAYWRRAHEACYARECARIGRTPAADMPVACERFDVIHRAP